MPSELGMVSTVVAILGGGLFLRLCGVANEARRLAWEQARKEAEEAAREAGTTSNGDTATT